MCINILFRHVCAEFGQLYQCRDYVPGPVKHGDSLQNYIPSCRNCFIYLTLYALYNTPAFLNIVPVNLAYNHPDSILYSWQNDKLLLYLMYIYMALVKHVCECWRKLKAWIMDGHGGSRNKRHSTSRKLKSCFIFLKYRQETGRVICFRCPQVLFLGNRVHQR